MPLLSRLFIKSSLVYLLAGFVMGGLLLSHKGVGLDTDLWTWLSVHVEFLLAGWILQLAMGTAYWMFPRFTPEKTGHNIRGYEWAAWGAYGLMNLGLTIFVVGNIWVDASAFRFVGRGLECTAIVCFAINLWPRTKPAGG